MRGGAHRQRFGTEGRGGGRPPREERGPHRLHVRRLLLRRREQRDEERVGAAGVVVVGDAPLQGRDEAGGAGGDALDELAGPSLAALDEDVRRLGDHRRRQSLTGLVGEARGSQVGERVLAHDLEHPVDGPRRRWLGDDERTVDECAHQLHRPEVVVDDGAGDGVHEPEIEAAGEDAEPPEDIVLVVVEEADRQRDRRVDAGRPARASASGRAEGVGPLGHELEELGRRQRASPRRRQLDGQGQAVDRLAERRDSLHRAVGSVPPGVPGGHQLEEQGDRRCRGRIRVGGGREAERLEHHHALARHAEGLSARREHGAGVGGLEEPQGDVHRSFEHVVAAVEHDDDPLTRGGQGQCFRRAHPGLPGDGRGPDPSGQVVERYGDHPIAGRRQLGAQLLDQARLADARGARDRDKPVLLHQLLDESELLSPPDQGRQGRHRPSLPSGASRREGDPFASRA